MIKPRRLPNDILGTNYDLIRETLNNFAKSRSEWNEYAKKLDPALRATMTKCFAECRENGFFGPHIGSDGEIQFAQATHMRNGIHEVNRVEFEGDIKLVAKQYMRPGMKIVERIR